MMTNLDKSFIGEDINFMRSYLNALIERHPEIEEQDQDILIKFERRVNDIWNRLAK